MSTIIQATEAHLPAVHAIFWEYLQWANGELRQHYGIQFDIATMHVRDMEAIGVFLPPVGRLLVALDSGKLVGCACLRLQHAEFAELKRMYVRPCNRRKGIGRALVEALTTEARTSGATTLRLDSARFMTEAHALYRSLGFVEIPPYAESEIPEAFRDHWIFMERALAD
jgi:GNAT superfamily N-acetyltransferase